MNHIDLTLSTILNSILNEDTNLSSFMDNKDKINYAIDNNLMISLNYDDGKGNEGYNPAYGNPRGFRRIIPYCLGKRKGRLALRGFHSWKKHTKRGPFKWKFFYLDRMKNVRVYKNMQIPYIPKLANPTGDMHMDTIINMIGMHKNTNPYDEKDMQKNTAPDSDVNKTGPIRADQQKVVKPSRYAGISKRYNAIQKNLNDFEKQNTPETRQQRWVDYEKAERERQEQIKQQEVPNPPVTKPGPLGKEESEQYDNYSNNKDI